MRVAVCTAPNCIEVQERSVPELGAEQVLMRVALCGVCGSDIAVWRGSARQQYPYTPGHEFCGVIEDMAHAFVGLEPGQRVVVDPNLGCGRCSFCLQDRPNLCDQLKSRPIKSNGGLADYVALDYRMVHPLPDAIPDNLAHFVEPLSCALHMVSRAGPEAGTRVVVLGAGSTGKLVGAALRFLGGEPVFVEVSEKRRLEVSRLLRAEALSPDELEVSDLMGTIEVAIECTGSADAVAQAIRSLRKAGRLVLAGLFEDASGTGIPLADITTRELEVIGSWLNPDTFTKALAAVVQLRDLLSCLETDRYPLDGVAEAFELAARPDAPKALVIP